jgi:hypothetical protein
MSVETIMPNADDILWFKSNFHTKIKATVAGTKFSLDLVTAIACQETGYIWQNLRRKPQFDVGRILELCVGDTIDFKGKKKGRQALPLNKADLLKLPNGTPRPNGQAMFDIARQCLLDVGAATGIKEFLVAAKNPAKFCRGYGIFQYDLQAFRDEPDYFLTKRWGTFSASLGKCIDELNEKLKVIKYDKKPALTDLEMVHVAIAYNQGSFKPGLGLRQGHQDESGKFYGEYLFEYLRLSQTVPTPGSAPLIPPPGPGFAPLAPVPPLVAGGPLFEVDAREAPLRLRSAPKVDPANVITHLPDGQPLRVTKKGRRRGFVEVETLFRGARHTGFVKAEFLQRAKLAAPIARLDGITSAAVANIPAVHAPRTQGSITKRTKLADAHSLNESGQPGRQGTTVDERRAELAEIIAWLAVDKPAHVRYQPGNGKTFCNVYVHDYCHLAGVYIPRVWWSQAAIAALAQGHPVAPRLGSTIDEQRANDIFRWLRDFGPSFGWRGATSLDELQLEVNLGAIGVIIARRRIEGRSGHMVVVVPETTEQSAKRNAAGHVTKPLQSQAGAVNFRYGTSSLDWWLDDRFAESAFWIHP